MGAGTCGLELMYAKLGAAYAKLNKHAEAAMNFEHALALDPLLQAAKDGMEALESSEGQEGAVDGEDQMT